MNAGRARRVERFPFHIAVGIDFISVVFNPRLTCVLFSSSHHLRGIFQLKKMSSQDFCQNRAPKPAGGTGIRSRGQDQVDLFRRGAARRTTQDPGYGGNETCSLQRRGGECKSPFCAGRSGGGAAARRLRGASCPFRTNRQAQSVGRQRRAAYTCSRNDGVARSPH